jgi:putative tryptophan/tyrosine transport system substrate-binding protein
MRRSGLAIVLTLVLLALGAPLATEAQAPPKEPRVGYLSIGSASDPRRVAIYEAFRQSLRDRGYIENRNISIERRFAEGNYDRLPGLAAELVRRRVDVIAAYSTPAAKAALGATKSIPIVMSGVVDPVATGLVVGLARPGGNATGLSLMAPEIVGKQMQLLKELIPSVSRIAVLWNPANPSGAPQLQEAEVAARALKVQLQPLEARSGNDLDKAFAAMTRVRADGMIVVVDGMFIDSRIRLARLAEKAHLPAVYGLREHVEVGGLMFYGASPVDQARRAATLVDKILKGAKPGDLPVEQPTEFELVINRKTARALGLSVPQSVLVRADEIIQ